MNTNRQKGNFGEQAACDYLVSKGYNIIKRNFYTQTGEVDVIAENGKSIAFCEIKTRRNDESSLRYGRPASAVGKRKQYAVASAAKEYLFFNKTELQPRLDVIEVYYSTVTDIYGENWYVVEKTVHMENAFYASSSVRFGSRDRRFL